MQDCSHAWEVVDSRTKARAKHRRYRCQVCGETRTTVEVDLPHARNGFRSEDSLVCNLLGVTPKQLKLLKPLLAALNPVIPLQACSFDEEIQSFSQD